MKHWKVTLGVLALSLTALAGCSQPCCLRDYEALEKRAGVPTDLATNPDVPMQHTMPDIGRPSDIDFPERAPVYLTLHEAIAMALENGSTGTQSVRGLGTIDDDLITSRSIGGNFAFGDSIRVLALDPAITFTNIEANLARYDAVVRSVVGFNTADFPSNSSSAFRNGQFTAWGLTLEKALPTGGLADITFGSPTNQGINPGTNFYSNFVTRNFFSGTLNPQYTPDLAFKFQQPLLQNFGTDINSLLAQHPLGGAQQYIRGNETQQTGIVIARLAFDAQRADFERSVNFMLANVEIAYWNLYGAFVNLYSAEQALRQSHVAWKISKAKYDAGNLAITQYEQTRGQYEQFRGDRIQALGQVLEAERTLRGLLGLPMEDGKRLVPVDSPTVAPFVPDWNSALQECLSLRPELAMQRLDLKQKQLELVREKNALLPIVNMEADYTIHGSGTRLDGDSVFAGGLTDNALRSLVGDHFNDYNIGVTAVIPLGYRAQHANVRAAKLRLAQSYLQLRDEEYRAERYLVQQYRLVVQNYKLIEARRSQREAFAAQVEARFKEFVAGKTTADFLLEAQRQWANALSVEYQAIVEYNNSLVRFQFAKGTLMPYNGIQIAEGPLPQCAQVRAVEHERQRAKAIVLREQANAVASPPCSAEGACACDKALPALPKGVAPSVPALLEGAPGLSKSVDDASMAPRPLGPSVGAPVGNIKSAPVSSPVVSGPVMSGPVMSTPATSAQGGPSQGPARVAPPASLQTPPTPHDFIPPAPPGSATSPTSTDGYRAMPH
jgi:outer membrane protein TolC